MATFLLSDGIEYVVMDTVEDCGLTEDEILAKDVPVGFTAKKTTIEAVNSTALETLWGSL